MGVSELTWQPTLLGSEPPAFDPTLHGARRRFLGAGAWVDLVPAVVTGADALFDEVLAAAPWSEHDRPMYDRIVAVPRLTAWYGPSDAPPIIEAMRAALSRRYRVRFTSCGCNLYRDGADSVAWHGDRIRDEVVDPRVAIVSVGEPRKLLLRPLGGGPSRRFDLGHGDLFVMGGSSQRTWQHCVPKVASAAPRMSITFRHGMKG